MCPECHHMPSGRFDAEGTQCYCGCHDVADAAPDLLAACEAALLKFKREPLDLVSVAGDMLRAAIAKAKGA